MKNTVLLVVDMQTAMIQNHPYNEEKLISNIKRLIGFCRENNTEVVFVRHDGGKGDELEYNSDGWQIYKEIAPINKEKIFDKRYNSAFKSTGLKDYLDEQKIQDIILVGMQTEYCLDTTVKAGFEYGFNFFIPEEASSTYDNLNLSAKELIEFYTYRIWKDRFAKVISIDEIEKQLK